jgi:hypothetical protein
MAFQAGMVVGKALGGWLLGVDHRLLWSTAIAVTVVGAIGTHRLDRRIHPELRFAPA